MHNHCGLHECGQCHNIITMTIALRRAIAGGELSSYLKLIHVLPAVVTAGEDERVCSMVKVRQASGLSGPEKSQSTQDSYRLRRNSHQIIAYLKADNTMLGYVQGSLYETRDLLFSNTSYKPASLETADMLIVDEVCVIKQAQGLGIAGILLDECIRHSEKSWNPAINTNRLRDAKGSLISGYEDTTLKSVQFTVLTSNLPSEILFTKFAQRHGTAITFGCCHYSDWGNYTDWTITLGHNDTSSPIRPTHLPVRSNVYETYSMHSGVKGYFDRQGVIKRVMSYVASSNHNDNDKMITHTKVVSK